MSAEIIVQIFDLIVTTAVGIWIATSVASNHERSQVLRQYFISELTEIKAEYSEFLLSVVNNKYSARYIKSWFKQISTRISSFEKSATKMEVASNLSISKRIANLQQFITKTEEMDSMYNDEVVVFTEKNATSILNKHKAILDKFTSAVIEINTYQGNGFLVNFKNTLVWVKDNIWTILFVIFILGLLCVYAVTLHKIAMLLGCIFM